MSSPRRSSAAISWAMKVSESRGYPFSTNATRKLPDAGDEGGNRGRNRADLGVRMLEPRRDQARDVAQALEQPRHHDFRGPVLARQRAQRRGHHRRIVRAVVAQHGDEPELGGARGADELL